MLKTRIIPTLLWKDVGLVKGVGFDSWRRVGTVLPAIKVYNTREVDELVLLDISANREGRAPDFFALKDLTSECFVPLTYGGGITSIPHIQQALLSGADKVALNSILYEKPELITEAAEHFGSQCVVVSIDVRGVENRYECVSHSGTKNTGRHPVDWAKEVESRGAGEILLTSVERDGSMRGYNLQLIEEVSAAVSIPVIASGGAGEYVHLFEALEKGASAVAAASIFHFTEKTPLEAKKFLAARGVPVRDIHTGKFQVSPDPRAQRA